jgi:hypothetical protein
MRPFPNETCGFRWGRLRDEALPRLVPAAWPTPLVVSLALSLLSGCGGSSEGLMPASYSPDASAEQALTEYDTNHDGFLDAKELERCPALKSHLELIDQNGDQRLSAAEIAARIEVYQESQVALKNVGCQVSLDGQPLQGATVTYVPEKFLGPSLKSASGVSDDHGAVVLNTEGEKLPGVQPGLFRVQVSKKNADGQEMIPARYNQDTTLGVEVYPRKIRKPGVRQTNVVEFKLTSDAK